MRQNVTVHTTKTRSRALLGVIAIALALVLSGCLSGGQQRLVDLVNRDRAANGRGALVVNATLNNKAQAWAQQMANDGRISHSTLTSGVPSCWRALGENVGVASSVDGLHTAWMGSSGHRANILSSSYTHIGVGVVKSGGRYWGVQVFMQAC